jgi:Tfp pilus assembly protein PilZ
MTQADRSADGPTTEKRTTPRIGVELWAEECCGADVYFHRVTNLSRNGFFIEKKLPFQAGQTVHIRLDLPGSPRKLSTRSRVVDNYRDRHLNLRGAGFQFLDMDAQTREGIAAYIDRIHAQE